MVLISSEQNDFSTSEVIDYLIAKNVSFVRINKEDDYKLSYREDGVYVLIDNKKIKLNNVNSFWYRRGKIGVDRDLSEHSFLAPYLLEEQEIINKDLNDFIGDKKLNHYYSSNPNKLEVLKHASDLGLCTPKTYLIDNKRDVLKVLRKHPIITKGVTNSSFFMNKSSGQLHLSYTNEINSKSLTTLPDYFFPSLFQEKIPKSYEVRSFFIEDRFWSMAIFSQKNEQTEVDFRRYDQNKPNRKSLYKLPEEVEKKLIRLSKRLKINSGSIDLIAEKGSGNLYFLEINPVGQFGMTSYPCNYNIEYEIADYLSTHF